MLLAAEVPGVAVAAGRGVGVSPGAAGLLGQREGRDHGARGDLRDERPLLGVSVPDEGSPEAVGVVHQQASGGRPHRGRLEVGQVVGQLRSVAAVLDGHREAVDAQLGGLGEEISGILSVASIWADRAS
ncbi:MAG: hypothetical protein ABIR39_15615 [Nocardioides sp.]|uniref:hypothetical protein n=1 Tax=Nocardioides sp. TaxID=35761 RepID=UPI003262D159